MASSRAAELLEADTDDFYAVLNVPKDVRRDHDGSGGSFVTRVVVQASPEEIKRQYRMLCMTYHPDKHPARAQDKELYDVRQFLRHDQDC
jgi:DnaJ-domain-containing protein 1